MDPNINFEFGGKSYTVESRAYDLDHIILPDGRLIEVSSWEESHPPKPQEMHEVPHNYGRYDPAEIALMLDAVLAKEV